MATASSSASSKVAWSRWSTLTRDGSSPCCCRPPPPDRPGDDRTGKRRNFGAGSPAEHRGITVDELADLLRELDAPITEEEQERLLERVAEFRRCAMAK